MKAKSKALLNLFGRDDIPSARIHNNAKKIILDRFHQNFKEALGQLQQTTSYTSWSNEAKIKIKELKRVKNENFKVKHQNNFEMIAWGLNII